MKFSTITLIYLILLDSLVFYAFSMRQNEVLYEFEQRQQDIQVNYAVDAATQLMLENTNDIHLDYTDLQRIYIDPQVALETYKGVMVRYYGWSDETLTRDYFEDMYVPFFVVAAYDGYYVYSNARDFQDYELHDGTTGTQSSFEKIWSPKIPYAEADWDLSDTPNPDNNSVIYIYTLGGDTYSRYTYSSGLYEDNIPYVEGTGFGTKSNAAKVISRNLTDACNKALIAGKAKVGDTQIMIPNSFSEWSKNRPVEYPTVLTYLDANAGNVGNYATVTFAIGGSRVDIANYYICYTRTEDGVSRKYYTYATNREEVETNEGLRIEKIYMSPYDCAEDGYYFDLRFLE